MYTFAPLINRWGFFVKSIYKIKTSMTTLFDFLYPPIDLSDPLRKEGLPFTYYPECGALVPDEGIKIHNREDGSQWYSHNDYHKRYSKRAIIGKILGIKPGFTLLNGNPYDWRRINIKWLSQEDSYWYRKRDKEILKATKEKIQEENLFLDRSDYEKFFMENKGNLD